MQSNKKTSQTVSQNHAQPITMQKRIGSTIYKIGLHFNYDATETLEEKIQRLLKNDLQSAPKPATMELLQAGWLSERGSA